MAATDRTPGAPPGRPTDRLRRLPFGTLLLVVVAYVPLLLTKPGRVGADTKTYLYLDPGRLLSRAASMWDPNIGLGTVTHQNIGYLWPMGPYYWVMEAIGLPDWVAQRLWLGSIILAAGLGVRWMLRELRWEGAGVTIASFAYALSPYLLHYGARISVILLPFAGLPWLIGLASRSVRTGGWRAPALFALVTLTVGGVNATSLLLVMVAPVLWMAHATFVAREASLRRTLAAGSRIAALTLVTSFWWIAGLLVQGAFGIPILRYTETYTVVAAAALSTELLRGLGYWFFYGRDGLGPWIQPSVTMIQNVPALALSFALPLAAFCGGLLTRFRHRGYFALITLAGLLIGVGAHPWDDSTPAGSVFKAWTRTDTGLAFRSTPRAVPLIALGLAVFLGAGVAAVSRWRPGLHLPVAGGLVVLICVNQSGLFLGQMVDRNLLRDEEIPAYWEEAAAFLDGRAPDTRIYEMPGTDFASYRWGNTVDPITPGLLDRPYVARELIPYGTAPSANLLNEFDLPLQEGRLDPSTIAPVARLLGVGDLVHRADLQYERFRTPRPRVLQSELEAAPGLGPPVAFGPRRPNTPVPELPLDDEWEFATPDDAADPAPVSVFPLERPRPVLRTVQASDPVVLSGDGAGIVSLAAAGRLQVDRPVFQSAAFAGDPARLRSVLDQPGTELVVTDTNRRQARRWGSVRENDGYTETAGERALVRDPADNRLDLFPNSTDDHRTVNEQIGGALLRSSSYGNPVSYTAGDRASLAMDGDPSTAWRVAAFEEARRQFLQLDLPAPVTTAGVTLLQSQRPANRWITEVRLSFDCGAPDAPPAERLAAADAADRDAGCDSVTVALDDSSRALPGQMLTFDERTFRRFRVTVTETNLPPLPRYIGVSDVGIAELTIPGVAPVVDVLRPPVDLLTAVGAEADRYPVTWLFQRRRAAPLDLLVADPEQRLLRWIESPSPRSATPYGTARLSTKLTDAELDRVLGADTAVIVTASDRLPGSLRSRAASAVDGDPSTAWRTPVNAAAGSWIEVTSPSAVTVSSLPITFVADGRHSLPTKLSLSVDGGAAIPIDLGDPDLGTGRPRGSTETVVATVPPTTGTTFRLTIDAVEERPSRDWFSGTPTVTPTAIAEIGLGVLRPAPDEAAQLGDDCRTDLVDLGDDPVPLRVVGTVGEALDRAPLRLEACGEPVRLAGGRTLAATAAGAATGFDVDLLAFSSAAGGGPGVDSLSTPLGDGPEPPETSTAQPARLTSEATVRGATEPYWVVLGQSLSPGFRAVAQGGDGEVDLGPPTLVNGFANGWLVDPQRVGADATVTITWTPQRWVWAGIWASVLGVLLCVGLAVRPTRRLAAAPLLGGSVAGMRPVGVGPLAVDGAAMSPLPALAIAAASGLGAWIVLGAPVAVAVAALVAVALAWRLGQVVLRVVCLGAFGAAAAYVVGKQAMNGYVVDFDWMSRFEITHAWSLLAAGLLALDPLVEALRATSAAGTAAGAPPPPDV
jgi:arabinofuranan 3-O-arabinosyltransferase